ncbi:MAG: hypothetical protein KC443_13215 [Anaerolineales bacterium]|nr:hypothetical protein [Anaerolineales bacterium]
MQLKRSTLIWLGLIALLMMGCQANTDTAGGNDANSSANAAQAISEAPTATPEPARPEPQPGPDSDGDWVSDADEEKFGTNPESWDTDEDGSTDFEEIFIVGSDPTTFEGDSDEDWLRDVTEELVGSDPNSPDEDRDNDGIPDLVELKLGADPGKMDTDGDLLSDFLELFLTETDPAVADPINEYGFPEPLVPWLPEQLQDVACEVAVIFTMDEVYVPNPEEADSPNDIILGDDTYIKYGLWTGLPLDSQLVMDENTPYTAVWFGKAQTGTLWDRSQFRVLNPVITECGDTVTLAVQALEDDSPFGGVWDMGTWRHDLPLVFNRLPFGWWHSRQDGFIFYGETQDSDYEYDFTYSFAVQLLSSITSSEEVIAEYDKQFAANNSGQTTMTNQQTTEAMILSWMLLGMFDSATSSGNYDTYGNDTQNCGWVPLGYDNNNVMHTEWRCN